MAEHMAGPDIGIVFYLAELHISIKTNEAKGEAFPYLHMKIYKCKLMLDSLQYLETIDGKSIC